MKIYLIRHGETDYNLYKKYCGSSDIPLNKTGIWQANKLAERLSDLKVDTVFSSDLIRASETAKIIFKDEPIIEFDKLQEYNFGIFEGLTYDEIMQKYPKLYNDWIENPMSITIPSGDSYPKFNKRINDAYSYIITHFKDQTVAVVSHSGPIKTLLLKALKTDAESFRNNDLDSFWKIEQSNSALNIIEETFDGKINIICRNDTSHLSEKDLTA
jgi:alpha-ribazole phosphatase